MKSEANQSLLLAYGNSLREDDGIAPLLAESLQENTPRIDVVIAHQLLPEHAELISNYERILFMDAKLGNRIGHVEVFSLSEHEAPQNTITHHFDPTMLLKSAELLYQKNSQAWCFSIESRHFDHSDSLSPSMQSQFEDIKNHLKKTIHELLINQN